MTTRLWSLVIGANDPTRLAQFWSEALGWRITDEGNYWSVARSSDLEPLLEFVPIPEPKDAKNRIHLDLASASVADQLSTVDRLLQLGACRVDIGQPPDAAWVVLADPEGNEFCVAPPSASAGGPIGAIAFDQADARLGYFWSEATGWPIAWDHNGYVGLRSPSGVFMTLGPPVALKPRKNRLHFDIAPHPGGDQDAEVERLESLGARRIDIGQGDVPWVVMADPEDNEFCVLTPR